MIQLAFLSRVINYGNTTFVKTSEVIKALRFLITYINVFACARECSDPLVPRHFCGPVEHRQGSWRTNPLIISLSAVLKSYTALL
jgi:hypothetical protein